MTDQSNNAQELFHDAVELARIAEWVALEDKLASISSLGSEVVFLACEGLCSGGDAVERWIGAHVLGALGYSEKGFPFRERSLPLLERRLSDSDKDVVCISLSSLSNLEADDILLSHGALARHEASEVRGTIANLFGAIASERVIDVLIKLSGDEAEMVRDWATFGLAGHNDMTSPAICAALEARLDDPSPDVRIEAVLGLANRRQLVAVPQVIAEFENGNVDEFLIEAAKTLAVPELIPSLTAALDVHQDIQEALDACLAEQNNI